MPTANNETDHASAAGVVDTAVQTSVVNSHDTTGDALLQAALAYAERGWYVLPCQARAKTPLTRHGVKDATTDADKIKAWWKLWPGANVAIACGPSGLVALDIDVKSVDGFASLDALKARGLNTYTVAQRTPSGGMHLLYHANGHTVRNSASKLGAGLDVRGDGGYIVVSPSRLDTGTYSWQEFGPDHVEMLPWPADLFEPDAPAAKPASTTPTVTVIGDGYADTALRSEVDAVRGAPDGTRNDTLNTAAFNLGQLIAAGTLPRALVESALLDAAIAAGLPEREARATITSGLDAGSAKPRSPDRIATQPDAGAKPAELESTWQAFTLKDAYAPRPPVVYAVDGIIELPSLSIVYGAPGSLKSFLLADMACCVAAGLPWLESKPGEPVGTAIKTTCAPVVWLDFDNGVRRTHERFGALGVARGLPVDIQLFYFSMPSPWLNLRDGSSLANLEALLKSLAAGLVIIDNLGTVSGAADENSHQMIGVMSNLRMLSESVGCALVVIHHQRKGGVGIGRDGDSLRGHSSIEAALDLALLVERDDNSNNITVRSTKTRSKDVRSFGAVFTYEHDIMSGELAEARFFGVRLAGLDEHIIDIVRMHAGINKTDLTTAAKESAGVGAKKVRARIEALAADGRLLVEPGETKNAQLFRLPEGGE